MPIIAAIDINNQKSSKRILTTAVDLANAYGTDLHVVTVLTEDDYEERKDNRPNYFRDDAVVEMKDAAQDLAEGIVYQDSTVHVHGAIGAPDVKILSIANRIGADYVVVGGRRRSPVGKALFGSVLQSILLNADMPVITVRGKSSD